MIYDRVISPIELNHKIFRIYCIEVYMTTYSHNGSTLVKHNFYSQVHNEKDFYYSHYNLISQVTVWSLIKKRDLVGLVVCMLSL